jgi:hypothetical protein
VTTVFIVGKKIKIIIMNTSERKTNDKVEQEANAQKENVEKTGINLDDYAGDEEDNKSAREQSENYMKDLDRNRQEQSSGSDSKATSKPNEI